LSPMARKKLPYAIECKNVEKINIWSALNQAESNTKENITPLLIFSRNRSKTYVAVDFEHLMVLMRVAYDKTAHDENLVRDRAFEHERDKTRISASDRHNADQ